MVTPSLTSVPVISGVERSLYEFGKWSTEHLNDSVLIFLPIGLCTEIGYPVLSVFKLFECCIADYPIQYILFRWKR